MDSGDEKREKRKVGWCVQCGELRGIIRRYGGKCVDIHFQEYEHHRFWEYVKEEEVNASP